MNSKAFLFDFDGTLADTLPFYIQAYRKALESIGVFGKNDREIVTLCFGKKEQAVCDVLGIPNKVQEFSDSYFQAVRELFPKAPLITGALELLRSLKEKQIKIAIITFAYRWYIETMLKQYKLTEMVDLVISTDDVLRPKPDPEAVFKACESFALKPHECTVVGDSKSDIMMAKAAGARSILYHTSSYSLFYDLTVLKESSPDRIVSVLSDIKVD